MQARSAAVFPSYASCPFTEKKSMENDDFVLYSPQEEYKKYIQQKMDLATRFREENKIELYRKALELGLDILKKLQ